MRVFIGDAQERDQSEEERRREDGAGGRPADAATGPATPERPGARGSGPGPALEPAEGAGPANTAILNVGPPGL